MFVICPKCSAEYRIPADKGVEKGRLLKCSACHHLFRCPGEGAPFPMSETPAPETFVPEAWSSVPPESSASSAPVLTETPAMTRAETPFPNSAFKMSLYEKPIGEKWEAPAFFADERIKMAANEHDEVLPEEFMPLVSQMPENHRRWVPFYIAFYLVIIMVAGWLGWHYRSVLQPHFYDLAAVMGLEKRAAPVVKTPVVSKETSAAKKRPEAVSATETVPAPKVAPISAEVPVAQKEAPVSVPIAMKEGTAPVSAPVAATVPEGVPVASIPAPDVSPVSETAPAVVVAPPTYRIDATPGEEARLLIEGRVQNTSAEALPSPQVSVRVYNKAGEVVAEKQVHLTEPLLAPGGESAFFTGITPVPQEIARVEAEI